MQKIPGMGRLLSPLKILSPLAFESFNLSEYDVVISSSAAYFAKGVVTSQHSAHLAYIHTPPRALYGYSNSHWYKKNIFTRGFGEILNHFMRLYDFELTQRPDILIANSENIKKRIVKFYRRDSEIIYPPIDLSEYNTIKKDSGDYFLSLARLDPEKNIDLIIETFNQNGLPLKIVGTGREESRLKKIAKSNIHFLGKVSDKERVTLLSNAKALICAASNEDFGITSVESQAAGTPVIAFKEGGYLETVIEGKTGVFFEDLSKESLQQAIEKIDQQKFKAEDLRKNAQKFSKENFKKEILKLITNQ
jgi:glycosyltransferase involved in cell wall biosynthesis